MPEWIDSNNCNMDLEWVGESDEAESESKEACQSWCTDPARGSEFELEEDVDMCCGYEAWNNGPSCFLMVGGIQEVQTEDLENAVFSSLVFQFDSLEEYEEDEWEEDWEEDYDDEEDWDDMYDGCDFESFCYVKIGGLHLFCKDE